MRKAMSLLIVVGLLMGSFAVLPASASGLLTDPAYPVTGGTLNIQDGVVVGYGGSPTNVVIPDGVTEIGDDVFDSCGSLTSVVIPDSVTTIGAYSFSYCSSLTSVLIGNSVTIIGNGAFYGARITSIVIPNSVKIIDGAAFNSVALTSIIIPDSVTTIGGAAFAQSALTSIVIPDSVTTIGESALGHCLALTSVVIGNGVTSIGESAFQGSNNLTSVVFLSENAVFGDTVFGNTVKMLNGTGKFIGKSGSTFESYVNGLGLSASFVEYSPIVEVKWLRGEKSIYDFKDAGTDITGSLTFDAPENDVYTIYAKNAAGGESVEVIHVQNIDTIPPSVLLALANATAIEVAVQVTATDSESGIAWVKWQFGSKQSDDFDALGTDVIGGEFIARTNGIYTVCAEDNAGNRFLQTVNVTGIDKVVPVIIATWNKTWTNKAVKVNITVY